MEETSNLLQKLPESHKRWTDWSSCNSPCGTTMEFETLDGRLEVAKGLKTFYRVQAPEFIGDLIDAMNEIEKYGGFEVISIPNIMS